MTWQSEGSFNGPDEGGLLGENTAFVDKNDRAVAPEQIRIDAARGQSFDAGAGPDSGYLPPHGGPEPGANRPKAG